MTYAYQSRPIEPSPLIEGDVVFRPLIPVYFLSYRSPAAVWALADTGADYTLVPESLARAVGMTEYSDEITKLNGFGGKELTVTSGCADLMIVADKGRYHWCTRVGIVNFERPEDEVVVLGHGGFFEFFAASFDPQAKSLSLIPTPAFPGTIKQ